MTTSNPKKVRRQRSGFVPCAPELAYCSDCRQNRQNGQCPRAGKTQRPESDHGKHAETGNPKIQRQS